MIEMIGFDADDTLWHNEIYYQDAQKNLKMLLSEWALPEKVAETLGEIELRNLPIYGYGVKAFVLSMIETAYLLSEGQVQGDTIEKIITLGRSMLGAEILPHDHVIETLQTLSGKYPLMVITKGDLLDQTRKIECSGMRDYFSMVEVINDKTPDSYLMVLKKYHLDPETFLMVGNSLRSDVLPILELGGTAVHIPANTTWEHEMVPDFDTSHTRYFELSGMHQLPDLIASFS